MNPNDQDLILLQNRIERLEREVRELKEGQSQKGRPKGVDTTAMQSRGPESLVLYAEQVQGLSEMMVKDAKRAIHHALRDLLPALLAIIQTSNQKIEHLLLVASADSQTATTEWPIAISELMHTQNMESLATLCAACGNLTRVKLLQVLYMREECTKMELSQASGASGGNLYQQLGELHSIHLLTQPQRGHYRLTTYGRSIVEVLFWCADRLHKSPVQESDQTAWFEQQEPD